MVDCDDGRPNRAPHDRSPRLDTSDHGTQVNGVIAARKNGSGVYGVAYEARIASYGNTASTYHPWGNQCAGDDCPPGLRDKRHQWSVLFDQETARGIDWMRTLGVHVTNFSWSRTYEWSPERRSVTSSRRILFAASCPGPCRRSSDMWMRAVAVSAAGNGDSLHPAVEGVLPRCFPALGEGWLVVVGLGRDGDIGWRGLRGVHGYPCPRPGVLTLLDLPINGDRATTRALVLMPGCSVN